MSVVPTPKNSVGNAIKLYLFPVLVTILATLIWRDVTEMRSDVKMLLAQSNVDKTDIQNLKRDVQMLEQAVFNKRVVATSEADFTINHDRLFKHEDIFDINKYLPKS
jgi:hypothetical protein